MTRKKKIRNIIVICAAVLVLAIVVGAIVLLRNDTFGLNYFERNKVVATVGDEKVTMGEYAMALTNYYSNIDTYNMYAMYYGYGTYYDVKTEQGVQQLQEDMLSQLVSERVYIVLAEELGLTLTDEEKAECRKSGKDAYTTLEADCLKQAQEAGSDNAATYAKTVLTNYLANTGMTKASYIAMNERSAVSSKLANKLSLHYGDERDVQDSELPEIYEEYAQKYYVDAYYAGAYSAYIGYLKDGSATAPYLYVPDDFIFVRVITVDDLLTARDVEEQLEEGADFEELLNSDSNSDSFIKEHEYEYAIGANDSVFASDVYTAAAELAVGDYVKVPVTTSSTDSETGETTENTVTYFVKRVEGTTGVLPYDRVEKDVADSLISYAENMYTNEKIEAWKTNAVWVDTASRDAFNPAA